MVSLLWSQPSMIIPNLLGDRVSSVALTPSEIERYARHLICPRWPCRGRSGSRPPRCSASARAGWVLRCRISRGGGCRHDWPGPTLTSLTFPTSSANHSLHRRRGAAQDRQRRGKAQSDQPRSEDCPPRAHGHSSNALALFADYDVIVDGTDNFPTRYLVNDACVLLGKPNVYGSIFRFDGQATVFFPPEGPCYRCLYPEPPPPGLVPNWRRRRAYWASCRALIGVSRRP